MSRHQLTMFDGQRLTLEDSIELTAQSLSAYALDYRHWAVAFSGGKARIPHQEAKNA